MSSPLLKAGPDAHPSDLGLDCAELEGERPRGRGQGPVWDESCTCALHWPCTHAIISLTHSFSLSISLSFRPSSSPSSSLFPLSLHASLSLHPELSSRTHSSLRLSMTPSHASGARPDTRRVISEPGGSGYARSSPPPDIYDKSYQGAGRLSSPNREFPHLVEVRDGPSRWPAGSHPPGLCARTPLWGGLCTGRRGERVEWLACHQRHQCERQ